MRRQTENKEQLPLVIRYLDSSLKIREVFLAFSECKEGVSGEAISKLILDTLESVGLSMDKCRGQCYDGAGNMAGRCRGAAARIAQQHPEALYTHCGSHRLNLCGMQVCTVQAVRNMFGTVEQLSLFFSLSPKRQAQLEADIKQCLPESKHKKLVNVCRTRN